MKRAGGWLSPMQLRCSFTSRARTERDGARSSCREPSSRSAMTNMFVPVFLDPGPDSLLHSLFLALCETGVPKTMYTGCAVCKGWNVRVKDMTEQEMSALCSAACGDTTMCAFCSRLRPIALPFNATGAQMEPIKVLPQAAPSTRSVLRAAVTGDRGQIDPLLWVLLNHLATMAMAVACKPPHGKSFAHEFTMDLRGYSYYIVFEEKRRKGCEHNCEELLHAWWRAALETVMQRVQAHGSVSEADARASLACFVDKMASIPFHACRNTYGNQTSFREEGRRMLDAWAWP